MLLFSPIRLRSVSRTAVRLSLFSKQIPLQQFSYYFSHFTEATVSSDFLQSWAAHNLFSFMELEIYVGWEWCLSKNYGRNYYGEFTITKEQTNNNNKKSVYKFNSMQMAIVAMDNDDYEFQITHKPNFVVCRKRFIRILLHILHNFYSFIPRSGNKH